MPALPRRHRRLWNDQFHGLLRVLARTLGICLVITFMLAPAQVTPLPKAENRTISPQLIGVNLWLDPDEDVWAPVAEGGFRTIRIGGHQYDRKIPSPAQLLAWVKQIRSIGAEPILQVSQYRAASEAAELVRFMNIEHGQGVRFWNIGNEPWLQAGKPPWPTVTANVEVYFKAAAAAMKEVDPHIKIFGPDLSYFEPEAFSLLIGGVNNIAGRVPNRRYYFLDGFTYHTYPQRPGTPAFEGATEMVNTMRRVRQAVDQANRALGRTGDDALQWGLGEFNAREGALVNTWGNGQMFGQALGACMKYGATYAASWSMFESNGNAGSMDFGMIDDSRVPRATYHHMAVLAKYFSGTYADGNSSDRDVVVFGAVDGDRVSVMMMNRGTRSFDAALGLSAKGGAKVGAKGGAKVGTDAPLRLTVDAGIHRVLRRRIDPLSTTVLVLKGQELTTWEYTASDFEHHQFPTVSHGSVDGNLNADRDAVARLAPIQPVDLAPQQDLRKTIALTLADRCTRAVQVDVLSTRPEIVAVTRVTAPTSTEAGALELTAVANGTATLDVHVTAPETPTCVASDWRTRFVVRVKPPAHQASDQIWKVPTRIQAEDYARMQGLEVSEIADERGGLFVGWVDAGDFLEYRMEVPRTQTYGLTFRVATQEDAAAFDIQDGAGRVLGTVSVPDTGGWQRWVNRTISLELAAGTYPLRLVFTGSAVNLDWFEMTEISPPSQP